MPAGRLGGRLGVNLWIATPMAIILASVPFSMLIYLVAPSFFPQLKGRATLTEAYLETLILMLPGAAAFAIADQLLAKRRASKSTGGASLAPMDASGFDEGKKSTLTLRLPTYRGREIVALRAEDHYVRVYTPLGSHLVLTRFSDALSELGGKDGVRVHRSWWVARQAIVRACGHGRKRRLQLVTGLEAPVARGAIAELKARGWPA
jgi:hypothetical protein